ncbi:unnamed protein product [Timema podura]|uniref:Uncharacterized protein n=1 Tax=Timema podura TaxID=61482 RepID=A0ABN7NT40_TIMPD|nr:unnamed protein product [Timema podura]
MRKAEFRGRVPVFTWRNSGKTIEEKKALSTPDRDSNPDSPVIDSLVYCDNDALDHAVTEADGSSNSMIAQQMAESTNDCPTDGSSNSIIAQQMAALAQ